MIFSVSVAFDYWAFARQTVGLRMTAEASSKIASALQTSRPSSLRPPARRDPLTCSALRFKLHRHRGRGVLEERINGCMKRSIMARCYHCSAARCADGFPRAIPTARSRTELTFCDIKKPKRAANPERGVQIYPRLRVVLSSGRSGNRQAASSVEEGASKRVPSAHWGVR